jgi:uncharacterized membrane protein YeaQ/YmgE (transglycosylase-associated protein family)
LVELSIALGLAGWLVLIVGAALFAIVAQFVGDARSSYEWAVDGVAAGVGALVASEFVTAWQATGPVFDGLAIVPALIGGLVVGLVVAVATRLLTGGHSTHGAMSA